MYQAWLPREIGGVLWFGNDDGNMVAYTPVYCCSTVQPKCYNTPGADALNFSMDNAYWVCNWVSNMVYPRYSMLFPDLKEVRDSLERSYFELQPQVEAKAAQLYAVSPAKAQKYLNDYTIEKAQQMLARWRQLATYLIVKYNDMAVKPEKNIVCFIDDIFVSVLVYSSAKVQLLFGSTKFFCNFFQKTFIFYCFPLVFSVFSSDFLFFCSHFSRKGQLAHLKSLHVLAFR